MKKWMAALLAWMLISLSACALAFDLSPYVISEGELLLEYGAGRKHTASVEWDGENISVFLVDR